MRQKEPTLKVLIGWKMAEANGAIAVRCLFVIALIYRLAWPFTVLIALSAGWLSIRELEILSALAPG